MDLNIKICIPLAGEAVVLQGWAEACKLVFLNSGRVQEGLIIRI